MRIGIGTGIEYQATAGLPGPAVVFPPVNPNLLLWSEEFQQAAWTKGAITVTADQAQAPDETLTADLLEPTIGAESSVVEQVSPTAPEAGSIYAFSIYLKRANAGIDTATILLADGAGSASTSFTPTDSWVRYVVTKQAHANATELRVTVRPMNSEIGEAALSTLHAWGAKLEEGSVATGYIKREGV